jgi:secondary thiamine-phosphate synthase enzyme
MVHITDEIEAVVRRSGVKDGLCFVSPMHITAAIYVNDLESGLIEDIGKWLEELAPARPDYKHHQTGEDNGDAHLKSLLLHHETTLPVTKGRLDLGTGVLCGVRRAAEEARDREGAGRGGVVFSASVSISTSEGKVRTTPP